MSRKNNDSIIFNPAAVLCDARPPNQKCMYGATLAISGNHLLYLVIFGMQLEQYYFELVIVGFC